MKASTPSLIIFGITSLAAILFKLMHMELCTLIAKSVIIPSLFVYYLVSTSYKISFFNALLLVLLFVRDIFNIIIIPESAIGSFLCVLTVYIMLLYIVVKDSKYIKFKQRDGFSIIILLLFMVTICYSVLSLKLENLELDFALYVLFGIVLSLLSIVSITNYIKIGSYAFFNGMLMCLCFIVTDIFFMLYKFYFYHDILMLISIMTQFLSYFFMVDFLLEKEKNVEELYND
jgi:hypothetical protein